MKLVAGVDGWAGRHAVAALRREGQVKTLSHGDSLDGALGGVDVIHYTADPWSPLRRLRGDEDPDAWLARLVGAAREAGVQRLIYLSTARVYGPESPSGPGARINETARPHPLHPYERVRVREETWIRQQDGLEVIVLRAAQPADWGDALTRSVVDRARAGGTRLPAGGDAERTFLAGYDAGRALRAAALRGRPGEVYLAGSFNSTWRELCHVVAPGTACPSLPYDLAYIHSLWALFRQPGPDRWPNHLGLDLLAKPQVIDDAWTRRELTWEPAIASIEACADDLWPVEIGGARPRRRAVGARSRPGR